MRGARIDCVVIACRDPPDSDGVILLFAGTVGRALALGAARVDRGREITGWTVLADPEGNEFCVLQSRSDYERFAATRMAADPDRLRSGNASSRE